MSKLLRLVFAVFAILAVLAVSPQAQETRLALHPGISYFPLLPLDSPPDVRAQLIPIVGNSALEGLHTGIDRVIIGIHDSNRDASAMLKSLVTLAGPEGRHTVILVPQFMLSSDFGAFYQDLPPDLVDQFISWPYDQWITGGYSDVQSSQMAISSFMAIDLLMVYLSEKKYFPDLKDVVIAGHGTGGNFVHLYSAVGSGTNVLEKSGIHVHFLVANASSFLYFTASRPRPNALGFGLIDDGGCNTYNSYPYGVLALTGYAKHIGANAIKENYPTRMVTYLTGEKIIAADPFADKSCMAMMQGANTVARAWHYGRYVSQIFGDDAATKQRFYTLPKAGYDMEALFGSECGMAALFHDGNCGPQPAPAPPAPPIAK